MTTISRKKKRSRGGQGPLSLLLWVSLVCFGVLVILYVLVFTGDDDTTEVENTKTGPNAGFHPASLRQGLKSAVSEKRHQLRKALESLTEGNLPSRLHALRQKHQIVGERLAEVRAGTETVPEILQGEGAPVETANQHTPSDKPPMELAEIIHYLDDWIHQLHEVLLEHKHAQFDGIWQAYHDLAVKTLYPWDREYLTRMPPRRDDGSIFMSVATYRDENCFNTVYNAYAKAKNPEKLFIGLTQQNCHEHCTSGVLANLSMVEVPPDDDCYKLFCASDLSQYCPQIRALNINEPESLGPYAARFFTSKLWYGEQWFMQIDAHMTFANNWDAISIDMLKNSPSPKPILSHYPPSAGVDLDKHNLKATSRLCGPVFATSDLESQIIRLEGASIYDHEKLTTPAFAPFTAAGYFVAHSDFLREVPFDPYVKSQWAY
jgi:[Skp1-protein]-hydroxyproline N-acetylglucosaminyltransferase